MIIVPVLKSLRKYHDISLFTINYYNYQKKNIFENTYFSPLAMSRLSNIYKYIMCMREDKKKY